MIQLTVKQFADIFKDRSQYPEGSELKVSYKKIEAKEKLKEPLYKVDYKLIVGDVVLIKGGWDEVTKREANRMMLEDMVYPLISRGHYLLHQFIQTEAEKTIENGEGD
jgi:hypothetical protein